MIKLKDEPEIMIAKMVSFICREVVDSFPAVIDFSRIGFI